MSHEMKQIEQSFLQTAEALREKYKDSPGVGGTDHVRVIAALLTIAEELRAMTQVLVKAAGPK